MAEYVFDIEADGIDATKDTLHGKSMVKKLIRLSLRTLHPKIL